MKTLAPEAKHSTVGQYLAALEAWHKANTTTEQAATADNELEDERFDQAIEDSLSR